MCNQDVPSGTQDRGEKLTHSMDRPRVGGGARAAPAPGAARALFPQGGVRVRTELWGGGHTWKKCR